MSNDFLFSYKASVVSVYDGDTFTADVDLGFGVWIKNQNFRLLGINTPELTGLSKQNGIISRDRLRELIDKKVIIIKTHKDSKEKYGRWLAEIFVGGTEKSINEQLVNEKLAVPYKL